MRRLFWTGLGVGLGAASGVLVARRLRRTADAFTPSSMAGAAMGAVGGIKDRLKEFAGDVREGMAEREAELEEAIAFVGDPYPDEVR
jgi:hypothetical protein